MQFFMGLQEGNENARSQILLMDPFPSLHKAYSMLHWIEKQREVVIEQPTEMANYTATTGSKGYNNNLEDKKKSSVKCTHCNSEKHNNETCWNLHGYPDWHPRSRKKGKRLGQFGIVV